MRLINIEPFEKNVEGVDSFHTCILHFTEFHHTHVNCARIVTKDIPTVDAELVRHARWDRGLCTGCKMINPAYKKDWNGDYIFKETPYCPECGAKMDLEV